MHTAWHAVISPVRTGAGRSALKAWTVIVVCFALAALMVIPADGVSLAVAGMAHARGVDVASHTNAHNVKITDHGPRPSAYAVSALRIPDLLVSFRVAGGASLSLVSSALRAVRLRR